MNKIVSFVLKLFRSIALFAIFGCLRLDFDIRVFGSLIRSLRVLEWLAEG